MRRFESCPASQFRGKTRLASSEERGSHKAVADGSNPSRATSGGASGRSSGLYPLRRQISAARQVRLLYPLPILSAPVVQRTRIVGLHPTDAGSTPERPTMQD